MFTTGEDGNLELHVRGLQPRQWVPIYGGALHYPIGPSSTTTSAPGGVRYGLNPCVEPYTLTVMTSWGQMIRAPIFQPSAGTLSSTSSGAPTDQDLVEDYHEIGGSIYWNPTAKDYRMNIMGATR
jgi:hypothetical protein